MAERPSGTVTFLFTDIEGSTRLLRALGDQYEQVRGEHDRLLRTAAAAHGGEEVDTQGDSFFFSFRRAKEAVGAAADAQRALAGHPWPEGAALRVRMGLHTGEPVVGADGRYVGLSVHRAARIGAAARGGQVLLSQATAELVSDSLPDGVALRRLGRHALKDFEHPERVTQLLIDGLQNDFPRVRTERDRRRRLRLTVATVLLLAAGGIASAIVLVTDGSSKPVAVVPNSVAVIDPKTNRVVADVAVGQRPTAVAVGEGGVWVLNADDRTVQEIDAARKAVVRTTGVAASVSPVTGSGQVYPPVFAVGEGAVWVGQRTTLLKLDPLHNVAGVSIPLPHVRAPEQPRAGAPAVPQGPRAVAVGAGSIWIAEEDSTIARLDPSSGKPVASLIESPVASIAGLVPIMTFGNGALWLTDAGDPGLVRVDPETNAAVVTFRNLPANVYGLAVGNGSVWANTPDGLYRTDASGSRVTTVVSVGTRPSGLAVGEGGVWAASYGDSAVYRVDPATNRVVAKIPLAVPPDAVAVGYGLIWVTVY